MKKDKRIVKESTYDPQYIPYFIQGWLARMIVQYHVKHIQIQEAMAGTIITLIAESPEDFPKSSPEKFPNVVDKQ